MTYSGVSALTTDDEANGKRSIASFVTVVATLSDGSVLTKSLQSALR